jgi:hypothetical protein
MRVALVCLVLSLVLGVATVAYVINDARPHPDLVDAAPPPLPPTADERAATRTAESFAAAVVARDKPAACRLASDTQARELRCGARGKARWPACEAERATGSETRPTGILVYVPRCRLRLLRLPEGWRVVRELR